MKKSNILHGINVFVLLTLVKFSPAAESLLFPDLWAVETGFKKKTFSRTWLMFDLPLALS